MSIMHPLPEQWNISTLCLFTITSQIHPLPQCPLIVTMHPNLNCFIFLVCTHYHNIPISHTSHTHTHTHTHTHLRTGLVTDDALVSRRTVAATLPEVAFSSVQTRPLAVELTIRSEISRDALWVTKHNGDVETKGIGYELRYLNNIWFKTEWQCNFT